MMCACDKEFGERYLPHQLAIGTELETKRDIPVTLGFQPGICNECRGLPEEPHPMAAIYGRTTKVRRYYWREIEFKTIEKFATWAVENGYENWLKALIERQKEYKAIEKTVIKEIKALHNASPKYAFERQDTLDEIIAKYQVEMVSIKATYVETTDRRAQVLDGDDLVTVEEFTIRKYQRQGFNALFTESTPFHALFGIYLWPVITDPQDTRSYYAEFGNRDDYENERPMRSVGLIMPEDFGTVHYFKRRAEAVRHHFDLLTPDRKHLLSLFDAWKDDSIALRQFLWAHDANDVEKARTMVSVLPPEVVVRILQYLIGDYWQRYLGWPDLLIYNDTEYSFIEVKSSRDSLSDDQISWIRGNHDELKMPFKLVKIIKASN